MATSTPSYTTSWDTTRKGPQIVRKTRFVRYLFALRSTFEQRKCVDLILVSQRVGARDGKRRARLGEDRAVLGHDHRLHPRRADIDPQEHRSIGLPKTG